MGNPIKLGGDLKSTTGKAYLQDLLLVRVDANTLALMDESGAVYKSYILDAITLATLLTFSQTGGIIATRDADDATLILKARTNGGVLTEVATLRSGVSPVLEIAKGKLTGSLDINGQALLNNGFLPGDVTLFEDLPQEGTTAWEYQVVKSGYIGKGGTLRVAFRLKSGSAPSQVWGRIHRNGVAIGTERTTTSDTYTLYTEDISGFVAGDTVELRLRNNTGSFYTYCQDLTVKVASFDGGRGI